MMLQSTKTSALKFYFTSVNLNRLIGEALCMKTCMFMFMSNVKIINLCFNTLSCINDGIKKNHW